MTLASDVHHCQQRLRLITWYVLNHKAIPNQECIIMLSLSICVVLVIIMITVSYNMSSILVIVVD